MPPFHALRAGPPAASRDPRARPAAPARSPLPDWQHTNNQNLAQWADRATPTTVSQDRKIVRAFRITRAEVVPASSAPPFMHGAPTVRVTTLSPHGLVTGQVVGMSGTDGRLVTTAGKARGFDTPGAAAFVVSSRVFYYTPKDWSWAAAEGVAMSAPAARGNATLVVRPGVAFELVAEMARTIGSDPWVNVPHLATDDFVNKARRLWLNTLAQSSLGLNCRRWRGPARCSGKGAHGGRGFSAPARLSGCARGRHAWPSRASHARAFRPRERHRLSPGAGSFPEPTKAH